MVRAVTSKVARLLTPTTDYGSRVKAPWGLLQEGHITGQLIYLLLLFHVFVVVACLLVQPIRTCYW